MYKKILTGIIIKETLVGETDKIITVFTKEEGKISIYARGAKNVKSKFLAGTQLFTYGYFNIYLKNNMYILTQIDIINSFYNIRLDYNALLISVSFLKLIDYVMLPNIESIEILELLLKSLEEITVSKIEINLIECIFKLKFLQYNGLAPIVAENILTYNEKIDIIGKSTAYTMSYILSKSLNSVFNFKIEPFIQKELSTICNKLLQDCI